ncbi:MAG: N-acetyl-gamma-glutamyl-phosphate reductase [Actinomycetota bacterium]|nr:N-acetyl-gamma-glutamyl-phosphate reductase [Actinomycetota bacterium]
MSDRHKVGLVGARGHTGAEIAQLIQGHPSLDLVFASSRELAGQPVPGFDDLEFESMAPDEMANRNVDVVILALPDGASGPYIDVISDDQVIVDISADHRFDPEWAYGLPELQRDRLHGATRIANPGCYATAMQIALAPLVELSNGVPAVFGVSGYSGAGAAPGPRNDTERLRDNLMPYKLVGHNHEKEAVRHLGIPVRFMPHVHPAFRGLIVTAHVPLAQTITTGEVEARFDKWFGSEPLIEFTEEIPELRDGTGRLGVLIGGFATSDDGLNVVLVAALDNLLKGAAVQAIQNVNLALGIGELEGIVT